MADAVAVPPEVLASLTSSMADGVSVARETRAALDALRGEVATLTRRFDEHATREEPALQAHTDYLKRLGDEETAAAVQAKVAAETSIRAAAEATRLQGEAEKQAKAKEEEARIKARTAWFQAAAAIGTFLAGALSAAAAVYFGAGHAP